MSTPDNSPGLDLVEMITNSGNIKSATSSLIDSITKASGTGTPSPSSAPNPSSSPNTNNQGSVLPADEPTFIPGGNSSSIPGSTSTTPNSNKAARVSGKPFDTMSKNFLNYADMYKSPKQMNLPSKELIVEYTDALLEGGSQINPILQKGFGGKDLPGNRYLINTQTDCKDDNGQIQDRSIVIDNVLESRMDDFASNEKGLLYSFFASLDNVDVSPEKKPSSSPGQALKKEDRQCKYVKIKTSNQPSSKIVDGYVTNEDYNKIDPFAIEAFSTPVYDHLTGTMHKTVKGAQNRQSDANNKVKSATTSTDSSVKSVRSTSMGHIQNVQNMAGQQISYTNQAKKSANEGAAQQVSKQYDIYKDATKYPMDKLFDLFITYKSVNKMKPICIYYTLSQVKNPPGPIQNYYTDNNTNLNCSEKEYPYQYPVLKPGEFIQKLKDYAALNYAYKDEDKFEEIPETEGDGSGKLVNITNRFVPPRKVCRLKKTTESSLGEGGFNSIIPSFQTTYVPEYTTKNENYIKFWDSLEPYREPIINALKQTDYPQYFKYCPPSLAPPSAGTIPGALSSETSGMEGFKTLYYVSDNGPKEFYLLIFFTLFLFLVLLCVYK